MTVPTSPQNVAPPIDSVKLQEFYAQIDLYLQSPQKVSDAIQKEESENYRPDLVTMVIPTLGVNLNASEKAEYARAYMLAGWKEAKILSEGVEPGRGPYCTVVLRAIPEVMAK